MNQQSIPAEWTKNRSIYEVNIRQFTAEGTFAAFEKHLPRLKELGVGIIWFMPVQPIGKLNRKGNMGSYYSIQNYTAVNEDYGTLAEFKLLVKKIHDLGMFVLLDWVANHTAWDNVWTISHSEFYVKNEWGGFMQPNDDWTDVIQLNFNNIDLRRSMIEAMKFWISEADIDGFRCDMAHLIPTNFWNEARTELEKQKEIFMLAESQNRDLLDFAFDMEYTWDFFHTLNDVAHGHKNASHVSERFEWDIYQFPAHRYPLFFTSNHDENSWQGSSVERLGLALEAMNVLVFTVGGMPLIYNGQEAGLNKRLRFFEKDTIEWKDDKMFRFYQKLIDLRTRNKALWSGVYGGMVKRLETSDNSKLLAYERTKDNCNVLIICNLSYNDMEFTIDSNSVQGNYLNIMTGEKVLIESKIHIFLKGWEYRVYERG